jgi:hypothetical protein
MTKWRRGKRVELQNVVMSLMGAPDVPWWALPACLAVTIAVNTIGNVLNALWLIIAAVLILVGYLVVYTVQIWWQRRKREIVPELVEQEPPGKMGLILPLSPIAPVGGTQKEHAEILAMLERLSDTSAQLTDKDSAMLEHTNLESPLRAIEYHYKKGKLRDCWLITTEDVTYQDGTTERGSWPAARILEQWFFHKYPDARRKIQFHYGEDLRVHPRDYARMWLIVDELFEKAPYKAENIIVDITPGTKPMSIALALACLEPKRTMEYIVSGRHPITGEVLRGAHRRPILIDIDPYLYWQE